MKFQLPKTKNFQGFTLIELLIAIAILAVLATIALAVLGSSQAKSRDARRKEDINAIANALEANRVNTESATYAALSGTLFSSGVVPKDPMDTNTGTTSTCPGVCKYCFRNSAAACAPNPTETYAGNSTTFTVCANLEAGGFYCRSQQQ